MPDVRNESTELPVQKPVPLWRNRDYLLLWSGQTISNVGGGISLVAFPLLALAMSGSPVVAAVAGMLRTLPNSLYLVAGALVDRWNRKYVMILCDSGRMLSLASIPVALLLGHLTIWQLYVNAFVEGTLLVFFSIAHTSSLGQILPYTQLPAAMAQEEVIEGLTSLLGPALSGPLFVLGRMLPFVTDALSYLISVVSLLLIRTPFQQARTNTRRHLLIEIRDGLTWMWRQPVIRTMNLLNTVGALVMPSSVLIVIILVRQQHASDTAIGVILACGGFGAIAGSLLAPLTSKILPVGRAIIVVRWLLASLWLGYTLARSPFWLAIVEFSIGFIDPLEDVPYFSYRLAAIPDDLRGRVIAACRIFTSVTNPLGQLLTGILIERYGASTAIIIGWLTMSLVAFAFTLNASVRNAR